jgi:hypothetical protein
MITNEKIDAIVAQIYEQSEEQVEATLDAMVDAFADNQPALFSYLTESEETESLNDIEAGLLLDVGIVVWKAFLNEKGKLKTVTDELLDAAQDKNWAKIEGIQRGKSQDFSEYVDPFFEDYEEGDLLEFVLDSLADLDEDELDGSDLRLEEISKTPIFLMLKTVIDVLENA